MRRLTARGWLLWILAGALLLPPLAAGVVEAALPALLVPDPWERVLWEVLRSRDRWLDPAWQARTRERLAAQRLRVVIRDHRDQVIFDSGEPVVAAEPLAAEAVASPAHPPVATAPVTGMAAVTAAPVEQEWPYRVPLRGGGFVGLLR